MGNSARLAAGVVLLAVLGIARSADAKKIPIIYQSGEDTFESGPLPAPYDKEPALAGAHAGYVCEVTGVFWSYFSIDNCRAAAIRGNQFDDSPELAAAVKAKYPAPTIPFWADHGWKVLVGGVGALVIAGFLLSRRKNSDDQPPLRHSVPPKTQFHLAVVDGAADDRRAAFERPSQQPAMMPHQQPNQQPPMMPPSYAAVGEQTTTQYPPHFNPQQYVQQQPAQFAPPPPASPFAPPAPPPQPVHQVHHQPMMMPPVQPRPASSQHTQIGYIVQPAKVGGTPAPVLQQPTVAVAPQAYAPDEAPTIAEPFTQEMIEQLHEQYRRVARGSYTPQPQPPQQPQPYVPGDEQPTTPSPSPAVRAAQVPAGGWTAPTVVSRPRNK